MFTKHTKQIEALEAALRNLNGTNLTLQHQVHQVHQAHDVTRRQLADTERLLAQASARIAELEADINYLEEVNPC